MGDSNNSHTQKINYFKVGKYLEAIRYFFSIYPETLDQLHSEWKLDVISSTFQVLF